MSGPSEVEREKGDHLHDSKSVKELSRIFNRTCQLKIGRKFEWSKCKPTNEVGRSYLIREAHRKDRIINEKNAGMLHSQKKNHNFVVMDNACFSSLVSLKWPGLRNKLPGQSGIVS